MGMTGKDIYDNFQRLAQGTGRWDAAQLSAAQIARMMPDQAVRIKRLQDAMEAAWIGAAGDSAQRGVSPLALEHLHVADNLHTAQDLMSRQAASFHQAANAVRPMPPEPSLSDPLAALVSGQYPDTMLAQATQYNAVAQHNVDVMANYDGASRYNAQNMPVTYGALADNPVSISVHPASGNPTAATPPPVSHPAHSPAPNHTPPPSQGTPKPASGTGATTPARPGDVTTASGAVDGGGSTDGTSAAASGTAPTTGLPVTTGPVGNTSGRPGDGAGAGADFNAEPNEIPAEPGAGEPVAGEPGGIPLRGGGNRSGRAVSGATTAEETAAARPSGQLAEEPGIAGAPVGAGGQRDRDDEHRRKYPVVTDLDVMFADGMPRVAPEAFGESPRQREIRHAREAEGDR